MAKLVVCGVLVRVQRGDGGGMCGREVTLLHFAALENEGLRGAVGAGTLRGRLFLAIAWKLG